MKSVLLSSPHPVGKISDYKYWIEFQQRGSPHVHMLIWIAGAPSLDKDPPDKVAKFIAEYVLCHLPTGKINTQLRDTLLLVQKHSHSVACRKTKDGICRFRFPKFPFQETKVYMPLTKAPSAEVQNVYISALGTAQNALKSVNRESNLSLEELLRQGNISQQIYINALHWSMTTHGQPAILLERQPSEIYVNNYNKHLMNAWQANLDIQYVTNVYACVMYVASYISKAEKTLGDILKDVSSTSAPLGPKLQMRSVGNRFLQHRKVSAQESAFRCLSLCLTKSSRQVLFVATDMPEKRISFLKPLSVIQQIDDDDPEVFQESLLDKYKSRPLKLEDLCLADFASIYTHF